MQIVLKLLQILFPFFQKFLYDAILCEYKNNSTSSWICAHCYANRFSNTSSSNSTKYLPWVQLNSIIRIFQTNTIINLYKTVIYLSFPFSVVVSHHRVGLWCKWLNNQKLLCCWLSNKSFDGLRIHIWMVSLLEYTSTKKIV